MQKNFKQDVENHENCSVLTNNFFVEFGRVTTALTLECSEIATNKPSLRRLPRGEDEGGGAAGDDGSDHPRHSQLLTLPLLRMLCSSLLLPLHSSTASQHLPTHNLHSPGLL